MLNGKYGFINKEDLIVLLKGEDKKEYKIADALLVNNEKGFSCYTNFNDLWVMDL